MTGLSGVLPIPLAGSKAKPKARVDYQNSEEALLVKRVQKGDELAFRELVDRYQSKVFSIIYGILRSRNDAEDISQQVFAKIYFSIGNFDRNYSAGDFRPAVAVRPVEFSTRRVYY